MRQRLKILRILPVFIPWCCFAVVSSGLSVFDVREYGAKGDGRTSDTRAIQSAIEACRDAGGGTVLFPAGTWVTGTVRVYGRMTLMLEPGSVLLASPDTSEYGFQSQYGLSSKSTSGVSGSGAGRRTGMIVAKDAEEIAITGQGVLDGNGDGFFDFHSPHRGLDFDPALTRQGALFRNPRYCLDDGPFLAKAGWDNRPGTLAIFWNCRGVRLEGVTFRNAPNWTVHFQECDDVDVTGLKIRNSYLLPNDDGIDVYDSKNVRISDCLIHAGDDCIAVIGSKNVAVSDCVLRSRSSGIRIGYGTNDVRDCVFRNVVIDTSNRGVGIFVRGRGSVENILFSNCTIHTRLVNGSWWGRAEPIHISVLPFGNAQGGPFGNAQGSASTTLNERPVGGVTGSGRIRNIRFYDVAAGGESGIVLYGFREGAVEDITMERISLCLMSGPNEALVGGNLDFRPSERMETAVIRHDIPGVFGHMVHGLRLSGLNLEWKGETPDYFSNGILCEGVSDLVIDGFTGRQAGRAGAAIALDGSRGVTVRNCVARPGTDVFLRWPEPDPVPSLSGNDLRNSRKPVLRD
jgi:hypothetical protein